MSAAEARLLIMVAEGVLNKARGDVAERKTISRAGNNFLTGYSKSLTDRAAQEAQDGEAWLSRLEGLLARVKEESDL